MWTLCVSVARDVLACGMMDKGREREGEHVCESSVYMTGTGAWWRLRKDSRSAMRRSLATCSACRWVKLITSFLLTLYICIYV